MLFPYRSHLLLPVLVAASVAHASATPRDNPLLRLVPPGSEIVAGIEDPQVDHILLVTNNNTIDFSDFLALTGVDQHRRINKLVEVAASSPRGELTERLLLASGQFDGEHIFHAAIFNGSTATNYNGVKVLVIDPFAREQAQMNDTRWMAILDDHVLAFGTPVMVKTAIDRYETKQQPDPALANRLMQLRGDVGSWNVLGMPGEMMARHVATGQRAALWAHLLDHADAMTLGIHYGSRMRFYLNLETANARDASLTAESLQPQQFKLASLTESCGVNVERVLVQGTQVHAAISVSGKEDCGIVGP